MTESSKHKIKQYIVLAPPHIEKSFKLINEFCGTPIFFTIGGQAAPEFLINLNESKNNNKWLTFIIYGDYNYKVSQDHSESGINIIKHIRYASTYNRIGRFPIIVVLQNPLHKYFNLTTDNFILLSAHIKIINYGTSLVQIFAASKKLTWYSSPKNKRSSLQAFPIFEKKKHPHDLRNLLGRYLFSNYFGAGIREFNIDFDKLEFLANNVEPQISSETKDTKYFIDQRVLYIDDEHYRGWSWGMYKLFSQRDEQFDQNQEIIEKSSFVVIRTYEAAKRYLMSLLDYPLSHPSYPTIIFLDLKLTQDDENLRSDQIEEISGIKLLRIIREKDLLTPIIIFSGYSDSAKYKKAVIELGADDYWIKGIDSVGSLVSKIAAAISVRKTFVEIWTELDECLTKKTRKTRFINKGGYSVEMVDEDERAVIRQFLSRAYIALRFYNSFGNSLIMKYASFNAVIMDISIALEIYYPQVFKGAIYKVEDYIQEDEWKKQLLKLKKIRTRCAHSRAHSNTEVFTASFDDACSFFKTFLAVIRKHNIVIKKTRKRRSGGARNRNQ